MSGIRWSRVRRSECLEGYSKRYSDTEETPGWTVKTDKSLNVLLETVRKERYTTALSLGSGNGINEQRLAELGIDVVCIDFHDVPLRDLVRRTEGTEVARMIHPVRADLTDLPIKGTFDVVLGMKMLQGFSLKEQAAVVAEIKRLTKSGGLNLVSAVRIASYQEERRQAEALAANYMDPDWKVLASGRNAGSRSGRILYVLAKKN